MLALLHSSKKYGKHLLVLFVYIRLLSGYSVRSQTPECQIYESFNINILFDKIGYKSFPALFEEPSGLYLPIDEMFEFLKIYRTITDDGQIIKGYIDNEKNRYEINLQQNNIIYKGQIFLFTADEAILDMGILYLKKELLSRVFGFNINFNFRSLSANFNSDFELPIQKWIKQEKARENLQKIKNEIVYDTIISRQYNWLNIGTASWSYSSNQSWDHQGETRFGLGFGAELIGGEANIWLNYSDQYGFDKYRQLYNWRYVNNQSEIVRQIQLGRINNRTISSIFVPVDGFSLSNTPTTLRKALGDYLISNYTEADWLVELYINNVLIDFVKADASGLYSFKVPVVYGTNEITLRFYGPNGEERLEEKTFNMPYNLLPKGEFEYKLSGGILLDSLHSKMGRAVANYGITRWLTASVGIEYLSSINRPDIPFFQASIQPIPKLIIIGEYAHKVRTKGTLNYTFPGNTVFTLEYSKFEKGQKAIIYNYLEDRMGSLSVPFHIKRLAGYFRNSLRQYIYPNFSYNTGDFTISGYYRNYNINISDYFNWSNIGRLTVYSNVSFSAKLRGEYTIGPSVQYNFTTGKIISYRAELEKRLKNRGYLSLAYEKNLISNYSGFNISMRYDLSCMTTYFSSCFTNRKIQTTEAASGSLASIKGNKYVHFDRRSTIGRSGICVEPFIDVNFNGIKDNGEHYVKNISVKCNGGQIVEREKDSIIYITGLEPFVDYSLILDESGFENIAWRIAQKNIKVCTDPNQFKRLRIPVCPMGEVSGLVVDADSNKAGIGRILVCIYDSNGVLISKVQSESDGYFSYFGLRPGNYTACIDSLQLLVLRKKTTTVSFNILENEMGDIVDVGNIVLSNTNQKN